MLLGPLLCIEHRNLPLARRFIFSLCFVSVSILSAHERRKNIAVKVDVFVYGVMHACIHVDACFKFVGNIGKIATITEVII